MSARRRDSAQLGFDLAAPATPGMVEAPIVRRFASDALVTARPWRILSYGGGVDSFAMLVWAIKTGHHPDEVVFADVGDVSRKDPGEWPQTYSHITRVVIPLCEKHGIPFTWITTDMLPIRGRRSLFAYLTDMHTMVGRMSRMCTSAAKVERVNRYVSHKYPKGQVEMWVGFEAGEESRARRDPHGKMGGGKGKKPSKNSFSARKVTRFPMIETGMCRCRAIELIRESGHELPPGSACMFCPFSTKGDFQKVEKRQPEAFVSIVDLERNAKRAKKSGKPIRFAGSKEETPLLPEWIASPYKPRKLKCDVCGNPNRPRKMVGCTPEEMEAM